MQIVIDIPDNMQEMCRWHQDRVCNFTSLEVDILVEAIRNGIVLPKNHGRLLILDESKAKNYSTNFSFSVQDWISEVGISNATLKVIEADKEAENDNNS